MIKIIGFQLCRNEFWFWFFWFWFFFHFISFHSYTFPPACFHEERQRETRADDGYDDGRIPCEWWSSSSLPPRPRVSSRDKESPAVLIDSIRFDLI